MRRRSILIEFDMPDGRWSSSELEVNLRRLLPDQPNLVVWGEIAGVEVDGAWRKLQQLSRETEEDYPLGARIHSVHKALSFFHDMFPHSFWAWKLIGANDRELPAAALPEDGKQ